MPNQAGIQRLIYSMRPCGHVTMFKYHKTSIVIYGNIVLGECGVELWEDAYTLVMKSSLINVNSLEYVCVAVSIAIKTC